MRQFTLIVGILYVFKGILGLVPVLHAPWPGGVPELVVENAYGYLLGVFPGNLTLTVFHLAVGIWGVTAYPDRARMLRFVRWLAVGLTILSIMGLLQSLQTAFGLMPLFGANVWLHALTAVPARRCQLERRS